MLLGRVAGTLVASRKDEGLTGQTFLLVRQLDLALTDEQFWTDDGMPTQPKHGIARYR